MSIYNFVISMQAIYTTKLNQSVDKMSDNHFSSIFIESFRV